WQRFFLLFPLFNRPRRQEHRFPNFPALPFEPLSQRVPAFGADVVLPAVNFFLQAILGFTAKVACDHGLLQTRHSSFVRTNQPPALRSILLFVCGTRMAEAYAAAQPLGTAAQGREKWYWPVPRTGESGKAGRTGRRLLSRPGALQNGLRRAL